jgi:precorrin-6x reductase
VTQVVVFARRWFQRSYGNTYHTVELWVDGVRVGKSGITYGYGSHYQYTAGAMLIDADHPFASRMDDAYDFLYACRADDVRVVANVVDVDRKRDL